jgi:SET and MYND domain-containing protein
LEPIEKGKQIFISYITATEDLDSRQTDLKQRYFFNCGCKKCGEDESPYSTFLRHTPRPEGRIDLLCNSEHLIANARNLRASSSIRKGNLAKANHSFELSQAQNTDHKSKEKLLKQAANACSPQKKLFALHPFPKIMHELYLTYLDTGSYINALIILLFLFLNCDVYNYPQPNHPVRVIRLFTIAKLLKHLSSLSPEEIQALIGGVNDSAELQRVFAGIDCIDSFHAVMIIVWEQGAKSHGKESRFMREVEAELKDVEDVQRLRGEVGRRLRMWMGDDGSMEGRKETRRIFEGLRRLSECVHEMLAT